MFTPVEKRHHVRMCLDLPQRALSTGHYRPFKAIQLLKNLYGLVELQILCKGRSTMLVSGVT